MKQFFISLFIILILFSSCKRDKSAQITQGYPKDVADIILTKCATAGCHTDNSKDAAGGLSLSSWTTMFEGGSGGAVVIPYRADQSWLSYFVNTYEDLGIQLTPTMPPGGTPLTHDEVVLLQKWITNGAPSQTGLVAFSGDANRNKFYVANQGCDEVTVFDTKAFVAMRYIHVGHGKNSNPHSIYVSPDGKYWYVVFYSGDVIEKYSTLDDSYIGPIDLWLNNDPRLGEWSTMCFYKGSSQAFVVDFEGNAAYVDLDNLKLLVSYRENDGLFIHPHGSAISHDQKSLYITAEFGNACYKIDISNPYEIVKSFFSLDNNPAFFDSSSASLDPHFVAFSPDGSKFFITCERSNEVRAFNAANDSLIAVIKTGITPQEISFSSSKPYMFITCTNDPCNERRCSGSVMIINYNTLEVLPNKIQDGLYQPHGIAVDDKNGIVIIANENATGNGPAPHHSSTCGGNNGFIDIVDLSTLNLLTRYRTEVSVFPYFVAVKNN